METKRIVWVDYAKVMAIYLVVVVHANCDPLLTKVLKDFLMPVFFVVSGYLFSAERNPAYGPFAWKRFRQLIVPYLWINALAYIAWLLVLRHYGSDAEAGVAWHSPLRGILTGTAPLLVHDIPLWSLVSFFVVEMVYYPLRRAGASPVAIAAGAAMVLGMAYELMPGVLWQLPLALGPSAAGLIFYALGNEWRRLSALHSRADSYVFSPWTVAVAAGLFAFASWRNGQVSFYTSYYDNYFLFLLAAVSGSLVVVNVARVLAVAFGEGRFLRFLSAGTLLICGFHLLAFAAIKGVALFVFGIDPGSLTDGLVRGLAFATAAFLLTLPAVWIVRRYMRPLVDK